MPQPAAINERWTAAREAASKMLAFDITTYQGARELLITALSLHAVFGLGQRESCQQYATRLSDKLNRYSVGQALPAFYEELTQILRSVTTDHITFHTHGVPHEEAACLMVSAIEARPRATREGAKLLELFETLQPRPPCDVL
ncbi:hypothetical protein PSEUDO8Z_10459 [Pseudomonas sp. 8Z]|uniref:hypothetical protein n=1 Tax=Pseudomonas sp. 8Z TaxID=2653166 RepID=UPI0012F05087|nr:hypothetical protein [Pseudomonas sp. 8Z]VXC22866.1 hypothetical protein PSEUDO8Z_10459 [Pseudomonas sp. 8Z]